VAAGCLASKRLRVEQVNVRLETISAVAAPAGSLLEQAEFLELQDKFVRLDVGAVNVLLHHFYRCQRMPKPLLQLILQNSYKPKYDCATGRLI